MSRKCFNPKSEAEKYKYLAHSVSDLQLKLSCTAWNQAEKNTSFWTTLVALDQQINDYNFVGKKSNFTVTVRLQHPYTNKRKYYELIQVNIIKQLGIFVQPQQICQHHYNRE